MYNNTILIATAFATTSKKIMITMIIMILI